jgi:hypothetical protein
MDPTVWLDGARPALSTFSKKSLLNWKIQPACTLCSVIKQENINLKH